MLKRALHFIKYNNLSVIILLGLFLVSSSVFAQTETGQEVIGEKQVTYEGVDNTLLLQADLDNLDMDFQIEGITQDEKYYYVTYTYINLEPINNAWQYQLREKKRKVSRKLRMDLGKYLAKQLKQEYDERIKELKEAKQQAGDDGETQAVEVQEYTGLIGATLDIVGNIFPGYEPVKKTVLPSPSLPSLLTNNRENIDTSIQTSNNVVDDLTDVYNDYINENDPDLDNVFGETDNCPLSANPDQLDSDGDGAGDACDVDVIGEGDDLNDNLEGTDSSEGTDQSAPVDDNQQLSPEPEIEPDVEVIELPAGDGSADSYDNGSNEVSSGTTTN